MVLVDHVAGARARSRSLPTPKASPIRPEAGLTAGRRRTGNSPTHHLTIQGPRTSVQRFNCRFALRKCARTKASRRGAARAYRDMDR
jgi:hypothetical protein